MTKLVLFGDSITAGYLGEAVSPVLTNLVKGRSFCTKSIPGISIVNAGIPGDTTAGGLAQTGKGCTG